MTDAAPSPPTPGILRRIVRSAMMAGGGFLLLVLGLGTISMCGPNRHIPAALAGALGAVLLGHVRKARRLFWHGVLGGVLGALGVVALMQLLHGSCDSLVFAAIGGAFEGAGIGLLADASRRPRPASRAPDPPEAV